MNELIGLEAHELNILQNGSCITSSSFLGVSKSGSPDHEVTTSSASGIGPQYLKQTEDRYIYIISSYVTQINYSRCSEKKCACQLLQRARWTVRNVQMVWSRTL